MEVLDLSLNLINGSLRSDFGGNSLHYLNLSYNNLCGTIPPDFADKIPDFLVQSSAAAQAQTSPTPMATPTPKLRPLPRTRTLLVVAFADQWRVFCLILNSMTRARRWE